MAFAFLNLPLELILQIFSRLSTVKDALNLAATCTQLQDLFQNGNTGINILRSIVDVPVHASYDLETPFSALIQVSPTTWHLQGEENCSYFLTVDPSTFPQEKIAQYTIRDMRSIHHSIDSGESPVPSSPSSPSSPPPQPAFQTSLHEFLSQFEDIQDRWLQVYDQLTSSILIDAARLQRDLLADIRPPPIVDLSSETTIIALALNCLVTSDQPRTTLQTPHYQHRMDKIYLFPLLEIRREEDGRGVAGVVSRPTPPPPVVGWHLNSTIPSMLLHIIHLAQRILHNQDPRDWPTIAYVLCIMSLIMRSLEYEHHWTGALVAAGQALNVPFSDLCRLYYVCTRGGLPVTWNHTKYDLDRETYGALVHGSGGSGGIGGGGGGGNNSNSNALAIEYFRKLQAVCLDRRENMTFEADVTDNLGLDGFVDTLVHLARGSVKGL
ncbi:hypothetical protein AJ80_06995 [Polytolypa hystricis UAMH7299]|uniref:F-box domain-containing protein n=1 Tax=Polytolypa hystricis (strain UAMH7299) TaxID=1447883 RepID=A0A2B7XJ26_POLH7|nr:hypothetical protein AJ80_06995 [Polytolypa hystricis UAMH7299]